MKSIPVKFFALILVIFFSLGMVVTISQYANFQTNIGFLNQKQAYITNSFWLTAFYIHVFSCFFCLFAGITQFSKYLLRHQKVLHRLFGKVYIANVFFINAPVGLVLAIYANGGIVSKLAFVVLDLLWFSFTLIAFIAVRQKKISRHKDFMIRSYALTLSAITFRLLKPLFLAITPLSVSRIYVLDSWLAFSVNLLIAEMIIYSNKRRSLSLKPEIINN